MAKTASKIEKYVIPKNKQKAYDRLVQRANRRLKANERFLLNTDQASELTTRALMGIFDDHKNWATEKTPFSRSKTFASEKEYKQTIRMLEQWGADKKNYERSPAMVRKSYEKSIVQALTTTAVDNGESILLSDDRLPGDLRKKISEMSLEQLVHFFDVGDPRDEIEQAGWGSDEYLGADRETFVNITTAHIELLQALYPNSYDPSKKKKKKKKKQKNKK